MLLLTDAKQILAWLSTALSRRAVESHKCTGTGPNEVLESLDKHCLKRAWRLFPLAASIQPLAQQGGCSYTLSVRLGHDQAKVNTKSSNEPGGETVVLQFRPRRFALDLALCRRARQIYGPLIATVVSRGRLADGCVELDVYEMSLVPGVRFDSLQPRPHDLDSESMQKLQVLLSGLADFFAAGFQAASTSTTWHDCKGRVGASLLLRLQKLSLELPTPALRARAKTVLDAVESGALDGLPVILTHGDLLPSNIMVDRKTWQLTGLVDWAEAEDLPFGIGLYGVEHLFGYLDQAKGRWVRYKQSGGLRSFFWDCLVQRLPGLEGQVEGSVSVAREAGILLWHGFAWDDGNIDRVVNEKDDQEELGMLRALLEASGEEALETSKGSWRRDSKLDFGC